MALTIHGASPSSVFRLIGANENSASFALGWLLEHSPQYRKLVIEAAFGEPLDAESSVVALQRHAEDGGYSDVELQSGKRFHAILEAKRWWELPSLEQLKRYSPRLANGGAERKRLISLSAAEQKYAMRKLPTELDGIPIVHLSWRDLRQLAERARARATGFEEKLWLRHLIQHLQEFVAMERQSDNNVFVVSLSRQPLVDGKAYTWVDVVEKDRCYFHPVGNNWPVQPPNYIGFRYDGKLRSVHHIDSFEVAENLASYNPSWSETDFDYFLYHLGPPMRPACEVRTGNIFRSGRVWCAIDTLLSGAFTTIRDARDETQRRLEAL